MNFLKFLSKATKKKGFTLIEVMISITVIVVGIISIFIIINNTLSANKVSSARLTAAYLAQEGIEIVRNIRDGNWLEWRDNPLLDWRDGIPEGSGQADYNSQSLSSYDGSYLNVDSLNGLYSYSSGSQAAFQRKIEIQNGQINGQDDVITVICTVFWSVAGRSYEFLAEEELYNWR